MHNVQALCGLLKAIGHRLEEDALTQDAMIVHLGALHSLMGDPRLSMGLRLNIQDLLILRQNARQNARDRLIQVWFSTPRFIDVIFRT